MSQQLDPTIIDRAPIAPAPADLDVRESEQTLRLNAELSAKNEELVAEIRRLKSLQATVKAEMMKPFAVMVFWFVGIYCAFVGLMLWMTGFRFQTFQLSDTVLGIISGSTAVAVIGLIGIVLTGLFGDGKGSQG